jgi:hypothetical protein
MNRTDRELRADCSRCCGLCCTGPSFDATQGFGYDKPAHRPCRHLGRDDTCRIHPLRESRGFVACAGFDCFGAGQWVTQHLFQGSGWRTSPSRAASMFTAYRRFLVLHQLLAMVALVESRASPMAPATCAALRHCVEQACLVEERTPGLVDLGALRTRVINELRRG